MSVNNLLTLGNHSRNMVALHALNWLLRFLTDDSNDGHKEEGCKTNVSTSSCNSRSLVIFMGEQHDTNGNSCPSPSWYCWSFFGGEFHTLDELANNRKAIQNASWLLQIAKICRYLKCMTVCDFFFRAFAVVFFITRLIIYPCCLLKSSCYDAVFLLPWFDVYYALNSLLIILLFLHIFWAYLIYKVAAKAHASGKVWLLE